MRDIAREPVDLAGEEDQDEFMDTGVLHDGRVCSNCGNELAAQGRRLCPACLKRAGKDSK